ncbi:MAG: type IV secretion protein DotG [Rhodospirillales bacterium]|nr:type IV secretion protein DotG [Rhodospirillales bacterium]
MSDDLDDDLTLDESFDDFEKKGATLGDMWRNNPAFKIGSIVGGAVLLFVLISFFSRSETPVGESYVGAAPDIKSTPGTEEAPPAYVSAIKELNEADIERAMTEGDSSLPVPIEPPIGVVSLPRETKQEEDPLQRWRRLQEERLQREMQTRNAMPVDNTADTSRQEAIQQMAEKMSGQMSNVLERKSRGRALASKVLTSPDFLEKLKQEKEAEASEAAALDSADISDEVVGEVLVPAGEIVYAQMLTEANSDVPGPVLAQILSGPLKGSRILGTFEVQSDFLTLNFDTVVYQDESVSIDGIALDPETTLPGMATEVDHRYFKRIVLPAATSFVQGFSSAIGKTATVTVVTDGGTVVDAEEQPDNTEEVAIGVEEMGEKLGELLDEMAGETKVLVKIHAGTPFGILFLEPVVVGEGDGVDSDDDDAGFIDVGGVVDLESDI